MERVAFLVERTNVRIGAMLNPESLVLRRSTGVRQRASAGGQLTGAGLSDDPLLFTGGGRTELELDLLFDVSLAGSSIRSTDVRDLTGPLWNLAENAASQDGYRQPALVRFVWGKSWNVPGVISSIAERLEHFTADGVPQRSWLRMRLLRVSDPGGQMGAGGMPAGALNMAQTSSEELSRLISDLESSGQMRSHEVRGAGTSGRPGFGERLDELAYRFYNSSAMWRTLAVLNDIADPLRLMPGFVLRVPPPGIVFRISSKGVSLRLSLQAPELRIGSRTRREGPR